MKKLIVSICIVSLVMVVGWGATLFLPEKRVISFAKPTTLTHLGIILDGNRRWARKAGLAAWLGHRTGVDPVKMTLAFCLKHKIPYLTLYAFSLENFKRPQQELDFLFNTLAKEIESKELDALFKQDVKVLFVGDRSLFPAPLIPIINNVEEKTKQGKSLTLTILFCYGGQQEIINAASLIAQKVKRGELSPDQITEERFKECLWTGTITAPDLIIRTGGMKRLSNFLSYHSAYSELYFTDVYWPDFTETDLINAINAYAERKRNFGT